MSSVAEVPIRVEQTDTVVSLDDLLGTVKVAYTVSACARCGRLVTLTELTAPVERELALA
jgi:hypothetical protein